MFNRRKVLGYGFACALAGVVIFVEVARFQYAKDTRAILTADYDVCYSDDCRSAIAADASERMRTARATLKDAEIMKKRIADIDRQLAN